MTGASFGSEFGRLDAAQDPLELLAFLDRVAATPAVREAKRGATAALALRPGQRAMDLGCGTGVDLDELYEAVRPGGSIVGIDSSARAIATAAERMAGRDGITVLVADAHELPFANGEFAAVRADRVLLHLERPDAALGEVRRVLEPGGRLAVLEMSAWLHGPAELLEHPAHRATASGMWREDDELGRIEMFLPLLLARAGFGSVELESGVATSREPGDADALLRLRPSLDEAAAVGSVRTEQAQEWLDMVAAALGDGRAEVRASFMRYAAA